MNYTEKYHLPQWEETDRIMRVDFNEAMSCLEEGIADAKGAAVKAAELPYVVGSYQGNEKDRDIIVGFTPSLVIICSPFDSINSDLTLAFFCIFGRTVAPGQATIIENGFHLKAESTSIRYPKVNKSPYTYQYIAFK